jgi:hypothetical protein
VALKKLGRSEEVRRKRAKEKQVEREGRNEEEMNLKVISFMIIFDDRSIS